MQADGGSTEALGSNSLVSTNTQQGFMNLLHVVFTNANDSTAQVSNHKSHHDQIRVMCCYVFDEKFYELTFYFQSTR